MLFFTTTVSRPLTYFRSFSSATRRRLAQYDLFTERFLFVFVPVFAFGIAQGSASFTVASIVLAINHQQQVSVVQMVIFVVDFTVIPAIALYIYKLVLLFYKILLLVCIAWRLHVKESTEKAFKLQKRTVAVFCVLVENSKKLLFKRKPHPSKKNRCHLTSSAVTRLAQFMQEHTKLLVDLVHFNRHFASVLIFWYYTPLLFSSIFILCFLYFLPVMFIIKVHLFTFKFVVLSLLLMFFLFA